MYTRNSRMVHRYFSSKSNLSAAEREAKLFDANEKMKAYYTNRPPIEVIQESKRRSSKRDREHGIQLAIGTFYSQETLWDAMKEESSLQLFKLSHQ
jgi:hypothetical protein